LVGIENMRIRGHLKRLRYGTFPGFSGSFPYFGTQLYFPEQSHLFLRTCEEGIYEMPLVSLLWKMIQPGTTYLDVGANIGLLSVPILKSFSDCKVISFEPSPNALPYLQRTHAASPWKDRWTVVGAAAGTEVREVAFCVSEASNGAFDGLISTGRVPSAGTVSVPMTTVDRVWSDHGCPKVSVMKIDVEGFEIDVLRGAAECISSTKPIILLEWCRANLAASQVPAGKLIEFAEANSYAVFTIDALMPVDTEAALWLQMTMGIENFLLIPKKPGR
jgi:FkbM family methyltransferase